MNNISHLQSDLIPSGGVYSKLCNDSIQSYLIPVKHYDLIPFSKLVALK